MMNGTGIAVVGAQFGDEGKGKIVDCLSSSADAIVRYGGGANAGHTIVAQERTFKLHLIPSGVVRGKRSLMGAGMVIDPRLLVQELDELSSAGVLVDESILGIDVRAHVILPYHQSLERARWRTSLIGTTGRGIGPAYEDAAARSGLRFSEFIDPSQFLHRLPEIAEEKERVIGMHLGETGEEAVPPLTDVQSEYVGLASRLSSFACDVSHEANALLKEGKTVLFEGAQGTFLDNSFGTYPFVTSSHPIAGGACTGAGVSPRAITQVHGIAKAYTTRVGSGPFPTELFDDIGDQLVDVGHEYGTTTGRKRRVGWLDVCQIKRAHELNGFSCLHLTKIDVLAGIERLRIAIGYTLYDGSQVSLAPPDARQWEDAIPEYIDLPGFPQISEGEWREVVQESATRGFAALPTNALRYVQKVRELTGIPIASISVGPQRESIVWPKNAEVAQHARHPVPAQAILI